MADPRSAIYESAFGISERAFDRKLAELDEVYDNPTPAYRAYLDKWFGPGPRWMPGHHVCSVCGEDIDFPGECEKCQTFIEWPMPGYADFDRDHF